MTLFFALESSNNKTLFQEKSAYPPITLHCLRAINFLSMVITFKWQKPHLYALFRNFDLEK